VVGECLFVSKVMTMARILVVDDEDGLRDLLSDAVKVAGYESDSVSDGLEAITWLRRNSADLVILDINLPRLTGFEVLEQMRQQGITTPVILLTARAEKTDITHGLRVGADDYLTKPFSLEELILRIRAILRRTGIEGIVDEEVKTIGKFVIDIGQHKISYDGKEIELSPTEFNLLQYFLERPNRVISKVTLLDHVWGMGFSTNTAVVDTYVSYLRKKLESVGFSELITVRGVGLQLIVEK
jgi:two-component system OmpR family response regulator